MNICSVYFGNTYYFLFVQVLTITFVLSRKDITVQVSRERRSQTRRKMSFYFPSKHQDDNNKEVVFKKKLCYFPNSEIGLHCPPCRKIFWIVCTWLTVETWWFFLFRAQQKIAQAEYNPQSSPSEHCSAWSICKFADHFWMIQITELVN